MTKQSVFQSPDSGRGFCVIFDLVGSQSKVTTDKILNNFILKNMAVFSVGSEAVAVTVENSLQKNNNFNGESALSIEQRQNLTYLGDLNRKFPGSLIRITEDESSDRTVMLCSNEDVFNPVADVVVADENGVFLLSSGDTSIEKGINMSLLAFNPEAFKSLMAECSQGKEQDKPATIDGVNLTISWVDPIAPSSTKEKVEVLLDKISHS